MARPPCATIEGDEEWCGLWSRLPSWILLQVSLVSEIRACLLPLFQAGAGGIILILHYVMSTQPLGFIPLTCGVLSVL